MNFYDIILILIISALFIAALMYIFKKRRKGGCSGCSGCCGCSQRIETSSRNGAHNGSEECSENCVKQKRKTNHIQ